MNLFAIGSLIVGISGAIEALIMFTKGNAKKHYLWGLLCIATMVWGFGGYKIALASDPNAAIFWWQISYIGVIFIPVLLIHFTYEFVELSIKWDIFLYYLLSLLFLGINLFSKLFINDVRLAFQQFYYISSPTISYNIFVVLFLLSVISSLCLIWREYKNSSGIKKIQVKYILLALIVGFGGGSFSFLPVYKIDLYPFLNIFISIGILIVAYAILRYRLMDLRVVARHIFIYTGAAAFTYALFYLIVWAYTGLFGGVFKPSSYLAGLIIAPLFVVGFLGFNKFIQNFANKYLFAGLYNYQSTINKLSQELNYLNDLDQIIDLIVNTIKQTMRLDRAGILLIDPNQKPIRYQIAKVLGFNEQNGISLIQDNFLTKYLEKSQRPLVKDELALLAKDAETKSDQAGFTRLNEYLGRIEASLCLPLMSNKQLIGIIVLGAKISNDAYTKEDLELLTTLSYQAGIAVDNARLYNEIQQFNRTLKQKVDEQTKDITEKNKYLGELLNMKNDFLRVVNHQLNTPLSIMRNAFAMAKEKVITPEKGLKFSSAGLERMSQTISDFWDAFQLEGEKMAMEKEKTDLEAVIKDLAEEKKKMPLAQKRNLKLEIEKPAFKPPPVWCDPKKIVHVVSNLLDNAVFYTEKGGVEVSYELSGRDKLKVKVKDTGVGIAKETLPLLFQKFSRGQGATNLHPDGSGLGLYIARKIIEGNDGELTAASAGPGQGATFSFTLPIYAGQKAADKNQAGIKREAVMIIDKTINRGANS